MDLSRREIPLGTPNDRGGEASGGDNQFGRRIRGVVPMGGESSIHSKLR